MKRFFSPIYVGSCWSEARDQRPDDRQTSKAKKTKAQGRVQRDCSQLRSLRSKKMWPSWVKSVLRTMVKACKWPSGPRDSRAKDPSLCGSNIREPDYLRHWYSGWGNCGSLMLLLQGRAETKTLNFFFRDKCARRMGKNHRCERWWSLPCTKKKFVFF